MNKFKLLYFVIFLINLYKIEAQISDKRLCVDEECKVPISLAKTLLRYSSPDSRILSFAPNVDVTIYSKSAGTREDLWGGEINGKRGYVPKKLIKEIKVLKKPTLLVDTEFNNETDTQVPSKLEPEKVLEPYEVVDGTTIYLNPQDDINPSSTESPVQSTALPSDETGKFTGRSILSSEPLQPPPEAVNSAKGVSEEKVTVEEHGKDSQSSEPPPELQKETVKNEEVSAKEDTEEETTVEEEEDDTEIDIDADDEDESQEDVSSESVKSDEVKKVETDAETVAPKEETEDVIVKNEPEAAVKNESSSENQGITPEILETKFVPPEISNEPLVTVENEKNDSLSENQPESVETKPEVKQPEETIQNEKSESGETQSEVKQPEETIQNEKSENVETQSEVMQLEETIKSDEKSESVETHTDDKQPEEIIKKEETSESVESKTLKINQQSEETIKDKKLEENLESVKEETVHSVEMTTLSSEIEVPQPLEDTLSDVTPKPVEAVSEEPKFAIPTLPPLGLFGSSNSEPVQNVEEKIEDNRENLKSEEEVQEKGIEDIEEIPLQNHDEIQEIPVQNNEVPEKSEEDFQNDEPTEESESLGFLSGILTFFGIGSEESKTEEREELNFSQEQHVKSDEIISRETICDSTSCPKNEMEESDFNIFNFNSNILLYLVTTAISVIIFLFGYIAIDKSKREGPLVAKINKLEKELLIVIKENQLLQEKLSTDSGYETNDRVSNEIVENLKQDLYQVTSIKNALEEQVQSLEKELENSTEVGMELNRMLSEILSSESGSDVLRTNVENLQRQLVEQQATINSVNETLAVTNTENHELRLELELSNKKVLDLQAELDKLLLNILKIEEEKETQQSSLEHEIQNYRQKYEEIVSKLKLKESDYDLEVKQLRYQVDQTERKLELKVKECDQLKKTMKLIKSNDEASLKDLLEVSDIKAELEVLKSENERFREKLQQEQELKSSFEKKAQSVEGEIHVLREKYEEADKLRVETQTKLEVLSNYFKDREAQWQKEISKHEALWAEKEGEATTTSEKVKFMQEQLKNYKAQTESLKQEIMSQEIELKSQISVLEKKAHENWVSARQAERKLEESKQEASQLRHRLTLLERDKNRLQSPIEQNGDIPESPSSPSLLYGTKSPPLPGLPPFLPPPPGVPFMPPPLHGVPPFIPPPPPNMFPGDHRPPPLGRMSSPPLNSRYSPSSRGYSPYDRNSSSPSDSEYGTSPPNRRGYSPYRGDYKRSGRTNGRGLIKGGSSGSGHSNESLEKVNRQSKV